MATLHKGDNDAIIIKYTIIKNNRKGRFVLNLVLFCSFNAIRSLVEGIVSSIIILESFSGRFYYK